jgi:hypothetical protein
MQNHRGRGRKQKGQQRGRGDEQGSGRGGRGHRGMPGADFPHAAMARHGAGGGLRGRGRRFAGSGVSGCGGRFAGQSATAEASSALINRKIHINAPHLSSTQDAKELVAAFGQFPDTTTLLWMLVDSRKAGVARVTETLQLVATGVASSTVSYLLLPMLRAFLGPPDTGSILQEKPLAMLLQQVDSHLACVLHRLDAFVFAACVPMPCFEMQHWSSVISHQHLRVCINALSRCQPLPLLHSSNKLV